MPIITSTQQLEIGQRYTGVSDGNADYHDEQRVLVMREATLDEWVAWCLEDSDAFSEAELRGNWPGCETFAYYEISTD